MMSARVIMKSGKEFTVKCKDFNVSQNDCGMATGCSIEGIVENYPIYLDFKEIAAVVREMSDEPACVVSGSDEADSIAG